MYFFPDDSIEVVALIDTIIPVANFLDFLNFQIFQIF
jgi:hypothetical protein